ncbi:hypothetical protein GCM10022286_01210 [Gryllotalpicola daejeonensis]|uniref:DUF1801 domain-containing protein n=1 Tax=Gryllotalpicola daejeonensis TaxID=993087 RepID=A0ABP7ZD23_9MICO
MPEPAAERCRDVEDYLASIDEGRAKVLRPYFERARQLIEGLEEGRSYGMPALTYRGKALVSLQPTKAGYSVYPFSGVAVSAVARAHPELETTSGSVHFTTRHPLPLAVFDELVRARRDQIDEAVSRR